MAFDVTLSFHEGLIQSFGTFVQEVLPWIVTLIILLVIGYVVSRIARAITTRLVVRFRIEEALTRAGVGHMVRSVGFHSVSQFFGVLVFWFLFLFFVLFALSFTPAPAGLGFLVAGIAFYIPRVIAAALIVVAGVWAGTWIGDRIKEPTIEAEIPFPTEIVAGTVKLIAIAIAGIIALNLLLGPENVGILTLAVTAAIIALAAGLGASFAYGSRHLTENLSGYLQVSHSMQAGDDVQIGEVKGTVQEVNRYAVVLRDAGGREIRIPNGKVLQETIVKTGAK